jgi:hypothetical protein
MSSTFRNAALATITAVPLLGAGQARANILYTDTSPFPVTISWEAPTFITPPTSGQIPIPGIVSCTISGGPCPGTPLRSTPAILARGYQIPSALT